MIVLRLEPNLRAREVLDRLRQLADRFPGYHLLELRVGGRVLTLGDRCLYDASPACLLALTEFGAVVAPTDPPAAFRAASRRHTIALVEASMADNVHNLRDPDVDADPHEGAATIEELEAARREAEADAAAQEEADGQFALEIPDSGRKVSLGTLIPRGVPIEHKYKMTGRAIPNVKGGLMDPAETSGLLLATRVVEKIVVSFTRDADLAIEKATVETHIGMRTVVSAHTEAGDLLLRGDAEAA